MSNNQLATSNNKVIDSVSSRVKQFQNNGELHFPANYSPDNALKGAWLQIQEAKDRNGKPALSVCTKESVANAMLSMVVQGLNPIKKQGYFIVYGNQLQFQRSYFGTMAVCKQLTDAVEIFADVVYEGDEFEYEIRRGRKVITKHTQKLGNMNKKKIIAAYCTIVTDDDREFSDIMTFEDIMTSWAKSKMGAVSGGKLKAGSTHDEFTVEMSKKTVTNRACKTYINSSNDSGLMMDAFSNESRQMVDVRVDAEIEENANTVMLDGYTEVDIETGEIIDIEVDSNTQESDLAEGQQTTFEGPAF